MDMGALTEILEKWPIRGSAGSGSGCTIPEGSVGLSSQWGDCVCWPHVQGYG